MSSPGAEVVAGGSSPSSDVGLDGLSPRVVGGGPGRSGPRSGPGGGCGPGGHHGLGLEIAVVGPEAGRAVEALFNGDALAGLELAGLAGGDLEALAEVFEGEVVGEDASVGLGEEAEQIDAPGQRSMGVAGLHGRHGEAAVPVRQEGGLEELIGAIPGVDAGHPQLLDEAVLEGSEQPLDATLGLGREGEDELDVEGFEGLLDDGVGGLSDRLRQER